MSSLEPVLPIDTALPANVTRSSSISTLGADRLSSDNSITEDKICRPSSAIRLLVAFCHQACAKKHIGSRADGSVSATAACITCEDCLSSQCTLTEICNTALRARTAHQHVLHMSSLPVCLYVSVFFLLVKHLNFNHMDMGCFGMAVPTALPCTPPPPCPTPPQGTRFPPTPGGTVTK